VVFQLSGPGVVWGREVESWRKAGANAPVKARRGGATMRAFFPVVRIAQTIPVRIKVSDLPIQLLPAHTEIRWLYSGICTGTEC
jgi:hypothetical protein